jgi:hypothetical protein
MINITKYEGAIPVFGSDSYQEDTAKFLEWQVEMVNRLNELIGSAEDNQSL